MDFINLFLLIAILMGLYTYYDGMEFSSLIIYLSLFALLILYFGGKQYLRESFTGAASNLENPAGSADFGPERVQNSEANVVTRSREIKLGTVTGDVEDDRALYVDEATGNIADKPFETPVNMREIAKPFAQSPINSLAEYDDPSSDGMLLTDTNPDNTEIDAISNNEGERGGRQESSYIKNQRLFDRKFEWSNNLPPSSIVQQIQQSKWNASLNETAAQFKGSGSAPTASASKKEGFRGGRGRTEGFLGAINGGAVGQVMKTGDVYEDIDGSNLQPVDTTKLEQEERAILNTFEFKRSASDIGTYNPDDVAELLDKYYSKQGKNAYYVKREDGVYEVFETEDKKAKVVYEEEEPDVAREELGDDMTDSITVPKGVAQYSSKLDPFFEPRTATRANRQDYTAFTPGLERMFAPTEPTQQWY